MDPFAAVPGCVTDLLVAGATALWCCRGHRPPWPATHEQSRTVRPCAAFMAAAFNRSATVTTLFAHVVWLAARSTSFMPTVTRAALTRVAVASSRRHSAPEAL